MSKKIVLTGGPCAGKTTARNYLFEKLSDMGFSVIFVPEVPTLIIESGLAPKSLQPNQYQDFQMLILKTQLEFEDRTFKTAQKIKGGQKQIMVCDRGCMDMKAYNSLDDWQKMLAKLKLTEVDLRDKRYDAVFHLVTAAEGKEAFYNLGNPARQETDPADARKADLRTRNAWLGHPHLKVIDNSTLFDEKMKRLLNAVRKALGVPVATETERKFLLHNPVRLENIPVPFQQIEIEQFYVNSPNEGKIRLRKRSQGSSAVYYKTKKFNTGSELTRIEIEEQITAEEYGRYFQRRNESSDVLKKLRICFLFQNQYFELDIFLEPRRLMGLTLLEIELTEENDRVDIPDWLGDVTQVTFDPSYRNSKLSKTNPPGFSLL